MRQASQCVYLQGVGPTYCQNNGAQPRVPQKDVGRPQDASPGNLDVYVGLQNPQGLEHLQAGCRSPLPKG